LRNRAWHFIGHKPPVWQVQSGESEFEVSGYYLRLVKRRPPDAAWAALLDDVETDVRLADAFFEVGHRVQGVDRMRAAALARPTQASHDASEELTARLAENASLMGSVESALHNRIAGYRYAVERLAAEAPSPEQKNVQAAIRRLARTLARRPPPPAPDPPVIRAG